ncbi:4906_t:CDS:2 [Racocetra fulgida]|uniref:4906_t:CDS:1 n=1 Tax=Racocetra fulgida TaxID=60492 RepID=A0A9N8VH90_9GLOM|nr:4906_t:CDS:2 [Racocetra fulgida]
MYDLKIQTNNNNNNTTLICENNNSDVQNYNFYNILREDDANDDDISNHSILDADSDLYEFESNTRNVWTPQGEMAHSRAVLYSTEAILVILQGHLILDSTTQIIITVRETIGSIIVIKINRETVREAVI